MDMIVFDFDDVLSQDNTEIVLEKFKDIISANSFYSKLIASKEFYECIMGHISFSELKQKMSTLNDIPIKDIEEIFRSMMESRTLNPKVLNIMNRIKEQGYKIALHSDYMKVPFDFWTRKFNLRDMFDILICSAYVGTLKNNTETYDKVLKFLEKEPADLLYIDRRQGNIETAKEKGIEGIVFKDSDSLLKELEKKGIIIN